MNQTHFLNGAPPTTTTPTTTTPTTTTTLTTEEEAEDRCQPRGKESADQNRPPESMNVASSW